MSNISKACCSTPPVIPKGYEPKGEYKKVGGLKTYVTGPEDAEHAILVIYDIFAFAPQTIQGADILASSQANHKYRVFVPDFFEGKVADPSWFSPDSESQQKLGAFFQTTAAPPAALEKIANFMDDANKQKGFSAWAVLGYCWGAKVANLTLHNPDSAVKCGVMAHPAMLDPADAKDLRVPLALLASRDEDVEAVQLFKGNPAGLEIRVETFGNMVHGWMAARADLEDEECLKEYQRGYKIVSGVFTAVSVIFSRNELSPWSHV